MMDNSALSPQTTLALMQQSSQKTDNALSLDALKKQENLEATARDFEAVFISEMIKPMFEGIETDGQFGGGKGEEVFRGMMIQEYGKAIAEKDITGIQTQVKNKLIEMQAQRTANESAAHVDISAHRGAITDLDFTEAPANNTQDKGTL